MTLQFAAGESPRDVRAVAIFCEHSMQLWKTDGDQTSHGAPHRLNGREGRSLEMPRNANKKLGNKLRHFATVITYNTKHRLRATLFIIRYSLETKFRILTVTGKLVI